MVIFCKLLIIKDLHRGAGRADVSSWGSRIKVVGGKSGRSSLSRTFLRLALIVPPEIINRLFLLFAYAERLPVSHRKLRIMQFGETCKDYFRFAGCSGNCIGNGSILQWCKTVFIFHKTQNLKIQSSKLNVYLAIVTASPLFFNIPENTGGNRR